MIYWQNQTKSIRYKITNTGNILDKIKDKADLQIEKQPVKSIGVIEYQVFNKTGTALDSLGVLLTLKRKEERKGKLINWEFKDVEGETNRVRLTRIDSTDDHFKFYLIIDPYNKSDKPVMTGNIIVSDVDMIDAKFTTSVANYEPSAIEDSKPDLDYLWMGLVFSFILSNFMTQLTFILQIKQEAIKAMGPISAFQSVGVPMLIGISFAALFVVLANWLI